MVRPLLRAARYVPTSLHDGVHVAAADEDAFTEIVTALERIEPLASTPGSATDIELVAPFPEDLSWAFGVVVGSDVSLVFGESTGAALAASLTAAERGSGPDCLVLVSDGPPVRPPDPSTGGGSAGPAGAAAFLFREGVGQSLEGQLESVRAEPSALSAAFELGRRLAPSEPGIWCGEWVTDEAQGPSLDPAASVQFREVDPNRVSEGAYVPADRYRESLPSRWRFVAEKCSECGALTFPARGTCRNCGRRERLLPEPLPVNGLEVVATTVIGSGGQPTEFDPQVQALGAYEVVLAQVAPGVRVTLQVADAEPGSIRIGDRVDTRLRRLYPLEGEWRYGRKAVPSVRRTTA
jgi:uncharacterized OB-fold protein